MKNGFIRVAAATPVLSLLNPEENKNACVAAAKKAAAEGASVLVFPELTLTGYTAGDLFFLSSLLTGAEEACLSYVKETRALPLLSFIGLPISLAGKLYNVAAAVYGGKILGIVPKSVLPTESGANERRIFAAPPADVCDISFGGEKIPFGCNLCFTSKEISDLTVAVAIGAELYAPDAYTPIRRRATLVAHLAATDETVGKDARRRLLLSAFSLETHTALLSAEAGEGESGTDAVYAGHSLILENGDLLSERLPFGKETLLSAVIDVGLLLSEKRRDSMLSLSPAFDGRELSFSLPVKETALTSPRARFPFVPDDPAVRASRNRRIFEIQTHALAGRMTRSYSKSLVLGLSGGLDSTLALLVAVRAAELLSLPRTAVTAVTMPGFGTTGRTRGNAEKLADALGVTLLTVPIGAAVMQHFSDIGHDPQVFDIVYENAQARERTQILMDIANERNGLVVGTGDMSELALGWATYNGDHMSMYAVNAGVSKTGVRSLVEFAAEEAAHLSEAAVSEILTDILLTPVSPELLPPKDGEIAQCTEGIVGPYELHDYFLYYMLRYGFSPEKLYRMAKASFAGVYENDVILGWLRVFVRRFISQQFKRSCMPDGPRVDAISLSPRGGLMMPSDASLALFQKELDGIKA